MDKFIDFAYRFNKIILAVILVLFMFAYFTCTHWLVPLIISYTALQAIIIVLYEKK